VSEPGKMPQALRRIKPRIAEEVAFPRVLVVWTPDWHGLCNSCFLKGNAGFIMETQKGTPAGTNPFLTVLLFGAVIAGLVICGSYVSKQRSLARDGDAQLVMPVAIASLGR
jgi:hypothetical protein